MLLEVIVTSLEEALEAEAGGADRLELVSALDQEGLSPSLETVRSVLGAVSITVRAMVRPRHSMIVEDAAELKRLLRTAETFALAGVNGLVAGFLKDGAVDVQTMRCIANAAPNLPITFHRAVDGLADPISALPALRELPGVDRVLTQASAGVWTDRVASLRAWRLAAGPDLRVLFAVGSDADKVGELAAEMKDLEVHVGRAAREPQSVDGAVSRARIARIKNAM